MMNDKIIWYKTFYDPMEAHIIRAKLEDSGFHCFLKDENINTLQPLHNQVFGGVKLMVFERDQKSIDLLLSEVDALQADDSRSDSAEGKENKLCVKCGSEHVGFGQATKHRYSWWVLLISIVLTVYPFKVKKCFHCYNCGHEFL